MFSGAWSGFPLGAQFALPAQSKRKCWSRERGRDVREVNIKNGNWCFSGGFSNIEK